MHQRHVRIKMDWGYRLHINFDFTSPYVDINLGCRWEYGNWRNIRELELTEQAIRDISTTLGDPPGSGIKFRSAMGTVRVARTRGEDAMAPPPPFNIIGDLILPDGLFNTDEGWIKYIIAHELGHRWDWETNLRLSQGLMIALGTWICESPGEDCEWYPHALHIDPITLDTIWEPPAGVFGYRRGCSGRPPFDENCPEPYALTYGLSGNPMESWFQHYGILPGIEDWAESFANVVYPDYRRSTRYSGLVQGGVRERYVYEQIHSLP